MPGQPLSNTGTYLRVIQGNFAQTVDKETSGAKRREYKTKDDGVGEKWELHFMNWEGVIQDITFRSSDYGEQCNIFFEDAIITLSTNDRYFSDLACKIFNADLKKPILLHPYDMETQDGRKRGLSMKQDGEKLINHFYDFDKKENLHGFPEVDNERKSKDTYWKIYFAEVEEFLVDKVKELKFEKPSAKDDEPAKGTPANVDGNGLEDVEANVEVNQVGTPIDDLPF